MHKNSSYFIKNILTCSTRDDRRMACRSQTTGKMARSQEKKEKQKGDTLTYGTRDGRRMAWGLPDLDDWKNGKMKRKTDCSFFIYLKKTDPVQGRERLIRYTHLQPY